MLVPIHTFGQALVLLTTAIQDAFFVYNYFRNLCDWEVIYVSSVQMFTYLVMLFAQDYAVKVVEKEQVFAWLRYAGWIMTCPVIAEIMCQIIYKNPSGKVVCRYIMTVLGFLTLGVTSSVYASPFPKWTCFSLASLCFLGMCVQMLEALKTNTKELDDETRAQKFRLAFLFIASSHVVT